MSGIESKFALHHVPHREAESGGALRPPSGRDPFGVFWAKTLPIQAGSETMTTGGVMQQDDSEAMVDLLPAAVEFDDHVSVPPAMAQANSKVVSEQGTEDSSILPKSGEQTATTLAWFVGQSAMTETPELGEISSTVSGHLPDLDVRAEKDVDISSAVIRAQGAEGSGPGDDTAGLPPQFMWRSLPLAPRAQPAKHDVFPVLRHIGKAADLVAIESSLRPTEGASSLNGDLALLRSILTVLSVPDEASGQGVYPAPEDQELSVWVSKKQMPVFDGMITQDPLEGDVIPPGVKSNSVISIPLEFIGGLTDAQATNRPSIAQPILHNLIQALNQESQNLFDLRVQHDAGRSGLNFSLQHKDLGNIFFTFKSNDIGISVYLGADRAETLDMLRRNVSVLTAALKDGGFENISFSFGDDRGNTRSNQGQERFSDIHEISEVSEPANVDHSVSYRGIDDGSIIDCRF